MATRVVVAEDEWLAAAMLRHELEQQGYEVVGTAGTGREAVDCACRHAPDVVLMDVQMPQMDGLTATRALMELCPTCVVIVTGRAKLEAAAEQAGAMYYVTKPLLGAAIPGVVEIARHRFSHFLAVSKESLTTQESLETWLTLVRAVKLLVGRDAVTEDEAFHQVQAEARDRGETLRAAASRTVAELLGPASPGTPAGVLRNTQV
jgi:response regulator NasT